MTLHFVRGLSKTRCLQTRNCGWGNKSRDMRKEMCSSLPRWASSRGIIPSP